MKVSYAAVLPLVALYLVAGDDNAGDLMLKILDNKNLRQSYNNSLNTTNVNQSRLAKIQKLYELRSFVPAAIRRRNKVSAVVIPKVAGKDNAGGSKLKLPHKKLRQSYNNLLNTATNVNLGRIVKNKKINELQSFVPAALRSRNKLLAVVIPKLKEEDTEYLNNKDPGYYRRARRVIDIEDNDESTSDESYTDQSDTDESDTDQSDTDECDTHESDTRQTSLRNGCEIKAVLECNRACLEAMRGLCLRHKCKKSMKKYGKKMCNKKTGYKKQKKKRG